MRGKIYQFGEYLLDPSEQRLQKNEELISLPPKVFEVLTVLVERHGQLVGYDELMKEVWQDAFVEDTNLRYCIHTLRKTLDKDFIETVPKRGYRFNAEVKSFTNEEFIQKYTDDNQVIQPEITDCQTSAKTKSVTFFSKPVLLLGIAILILVAGGSAYFIWKNRQQNEKNHLRTIAVLPFSVIGATPEQNGEIQKGLSDSMIFNLGKIKDLKVIPTNEIQDYFGKDYEPVKVGKHLEADEVLTGTYRLENNTVRINVSLLRVSDGEILWINTFTVKENTQIALENSISFPIARQIELNVARLKDEERIKDINISEKSKKNFLTAHEIFRTYSFNRRKEAVELFEKIIAEKPDWALANAGYATALVLTHGGEKGCREAQPFAQKALEIDSSVAEAHLAMGYCYQYNWDWKNAEEAYQNAIRLNPQYALAYHEYASMLDLQCRFAEAEINFKKAIELEPFSPHFRSSFCQHYYYDKNFNHALAQCFEAQKINSGFWKTSKILHWIYVAQGRYDEVLKVIYGHLSESEIAQNPFAKALSDGNIKRYWELSVKERLNDPKKSFSPYAMASYYIHLGDKEKTLEYLKKGAESPIYEIQVANADPIFDAVRKDIRFVELMKKINLAP